MNSKQDGTVSSKGELTVLGGGIVGLCCAIAAQKQGFKVSLLDKDEPGRGASFGNAGHFATEQMFPLASFSLLPRLPGMLLDPQGPFRIRPGYFFKALPWFCRFMANMLPAKRRKNGAAIAALNREAIGAMRRLLAQAEASELMCENGSLLLFERDGKAARQEFEAYTKAGVAVKLLSGDEVRRLEPSLSGNIKAALFFTEVAHTPSPFELCKRLELHFKALGGQVLRAEIDKLQPDKQGVRLGDSQGQSWHCDRLLLCCGAWSKPLAQQLGHEVPLDTERGYHLMMPQVSGLSRPVASFERKFIITPMRGGTRLAGTVEFGGLEAPMDPSRADCLLPHAQALLPKVFSSASAEQGERWMGFRPSLPDSLPILGASLKQKGVWFAFGHQHLGLTWAAITAELLASEFDGDEPALSLHPYRIDRF
ncbi:FAD-dependent oxidoreductase [Shewanella algae]|uniref:NAD(P)/FAD-dependent oxidoreductase n=1 Tax=Shewanella algae TaxID=38313 RepID=UPI0031F49320